MGRKALVTGAGRGVGYGIALELMKAGCDLVAHYNDSCEGVTELKAKADELGVRLIPAKANIRNVAEIEALFQLAERELGTLDIFVNNSGVTVGGSMATTDEATFDKVCQINYKGAYFCVREAANLMAKTGTRGSIVVISSNHQETVWARNSVYGAFKAALPKLVKHAAMEYAYAGIRVNAIAPGYVDTERGIDPKYIERTLNEIPLRRWVTAAEIGQMILFLSGPFAGSITGEDILMDGGARLLDADPKTYSYYKEREE